MIELNKWVLSFSLDARDEWRLFLDRVGVTFLYTRAIFYTMRKFRFDSRSYNYLTGLLGVIYHRLKLLTKLNLHFK